MKPRLFYLMLVMVLGGCATTNAPVTPKHEQAVSQMTGTKHKHEKKGICADSKTPPLSKCANTVTATFDNKGTLWTVWTHNESIYVQSSTDKGKNFTAPVLVNAEPEKVSAGNENRPKIKVDAKGNIYLTWVQLLGEKYSSYVRFSRSTDGGKSFSTPVTVNDDLQVIRHRLDSLAIGKKGEIFVVWLDARNSEGTKKSAKEAKGLSVYYSVSTDGGKHFSANKSIADNACECCRLDTAIAPDNTPVVVWRNIFDGGIRDHAFVKFKDWKTPDAPLRLSKEQWKIDACPHHGPAVSVSDSGIYHAVWFSNAPKAQGLFYNSSIDGKSFFDPINFAKDGSSHPSVLAVNKQVFITWQHFDGRVNRAYVMASQNEGKKWSKPTVFAETMEMADEPFLVSDGHKTYLSWQIDQKDYQLIAVQ